MKTKIIIASLLLVGCTPKTHDFLKAIEGRAYDEASRMVSEYCDKTDNFLLKRERLEARREIRQRGYSGPAGPQVKPNDLDDKTAFGNGPVVRIWCDREEVPQEVWNNFIRYR